MDRYAKGAPSSYVHVIGSFVIAVALTAAVLAFERRDISAPRYVFVDGGAHEGETIEHLKRTNLYKKHTWTIFAFEANPNLIPDLPKAPDVTVLNQAIWNQDGTIEFRPGDWFGVKVGDFRR